MAREFQNFKKKEARTLADFGDLRTPPHNLEAEQSILGSLMLEKDAVIKVADLLKVGDFYKDIHNTIYETMLELYEQREPLDVLSISNKLDEKKELERIGGSSYLASLVGSVPSASHIVHYAKVVQKKALLRRLILAASEIIEAGFREGDDVEKILDEAKNISNRISCQFVQFWNLPSTELMNFTATETSFAVSRLDLLILITFWLVCKNQTF
ncbi:MAG: Replicative DNA helicase [Candidatus Moranbacteria bacterium GW2011_GWD2_38_7]|nr:MAG: Replicative DNA helicase [Candidatus Moranbacteria bacterium GW2011_GWD2_38_7]